MKLKISKLIQITLLSLTFAGCTGQIPGSFRLAQQEESFDANTKIDINTQIDLLWVVDNSASMDVSQERLRAGFQGFAQKYMQPTWDIRVAVITTDTYLANPVFSSYLSTTIGGTVNWQSPYINSRLGTWVNPSSNPTLVNLANGKFTNGVKYRDIWPIAGPNYAKLLPGVHDGPIPALCFEGHGYFFLGVTNCRIRDDQTAYNGTAGCLNPSGSETGITQCVNTVENNTVRSGKAIISTMPPAGTAGDANWIQQLTNQFMVNVTTGSSGHGSERGLSSILQLVNDNESSPTAFFRKGSLRGVIIVSDEDDQSLALTAPVSDPWADYSTTCPQKNVDGYQYTLTKCVNQAKLVSVDSVKASLDGFFLSLDGPGATVPNYFVASIVANNGSEIQQLQADREANDAAVGFPDDVAVDQGSRYIALGNLVGNGSLNLNIAATDYTPVLDAIGRAIIEKKSTFTLNRAPTAAEELTMWIQHADGSSTVIPSDKFIISGKSLIISDYSIVLGFAATDKIVINYQPKTIF